MRVLPHGTPVTLGRGTDGVWSRKCARKQATFTYDQEDEVVRLTQVGVNACYFRPQRDPSKLIRTQQGKAYGLFDGDVLALFRNGNHVHVRIQP